MITCEHCGRELELHDGSKPINPDDSFNHECEEMIAALDIGNDVLISLPAAAVGLRPIGAEEPEAHDPFFFDEEP